MLIYMRYALLNLINLLGLTIILAFSTERNIYNVSKGFNQSEIPKIDTHQYLEISHKKSYKIIPEAHQINTVDFHNKLAANQNATKDEQAPFIGLSLIPNTETKETVDHNVLHNENRSNLFLTKEEMDCLDNGFVYYNQTCEKLFTRSICKEGDWLLLDLKSALKTPPKIIPKCKQQKCADGYIYWEARQSCYVVGAKTDAALCFPGNTLERDYYFGYGTCRCMTDPIVHGLFNNGTCFPLFTQGPCQEEHIFVENNGTTECIKNPCRNMSLVPWDDGDRRCYELNTRGPCDANEKFFVSIRTLKPICTKEVNLVSIINPPETCVTSGNKCKTEFKVKKGEAYMKKIVLSALKLSG